jgi:hypothetical protein
MTANVTADEFEADVIAAFGRHLRVRAGADELRARPSGRRLSIVCGDRVKCEVDRKHDEVLIVEVLPRRTLLARANNRGDGEPVVANITQLVAVVAPVPRPDLFMVPSTNPISRRTPRCWMNGRHSGRRDTRSCTARRNTARAWMRCAPRSPAQSAYWSGNPAWASHRWSVRCFHRPT